MAQAALVTRGPPAIYGNGVRSRGSSYTAAAFIALTRLPDQAHFGSGRIPALPYPVLERLRVLTWSNGLRERDKDIKLFYLEIDRLMLYEKGVVFTPGVANAVGVTKRRMQEAVAGEMIDYEAINRKIGSLRDSSNQARRQKAERTEILVPERVAMKWIMNFPNG